MFRSIMLMAAAAVTTVGVAAAPAAAEPAGVLAQYEGRTIDLGQDWASAQVCAEFAAGDVRCYRTVEEFSAASGDVGTAAATDCKNGWVCLWADINHQGRRLQWNEGGTKKLADWGFRDQASSGALHRIQNGATLVNYRPGVIPDGKVTLRAGGIYSDFREFDWNDIADEIRM